MAARRKRTKSAPATRTITRRVSGGGPTSIVVRAPAAARAVAKRHRRAATHHESSGSPFEYALAGAALGFLDKTAEERKWPTVPMLGRTGTIGLVAYLARKHTPWAGKLARAGFTVAGYQFLRHGKVEGDDTVGGMFSTV